MFSITNSTLEINFILNSLSPQESPINDKSSRSQWRQKYTTENVTDPNGSVFLSTLCAVQSQTLSHIVITVQ